MTLLNGLKHTSAVLLIYLVGKLIILGLKEPFLSRWFPDGAVSKKELKDN